MYEYERIIYYNEKKETQVRLTVNIFKGVEYLSLRSFYLSFEEEWLPTKQGVSMPLDLDNVKQLFIGLTELLSNAESEEIVEEILGYKFTKIENSS